MKKYTVKYKIEGQGSITVFANDENDAMDEIEHIFCGNKPKHDRNSWIDDDILWDIEWGTTETINAEEWRY